MVLGDVLQVLDDLQPRADAIGQRHALGGGGVEDADTSCPTGAAESLQ